MEGLSHMSRDSRALHAVKVAAIGPSSAAALARIRNQMQTS